MSMNLLDTIVAHKRREVARAKAVRPQRLLERQCSVAVRDFGAALRRGGLSVIAEFKRRSPSGGRLTERPSPRRTARAYERDGAAALSCLTDRRFFGGAAADLVEARRAVSLPVLRKEFILDAYQLVESRAMGADAVLLIARLLTPPQLREHLAACRGLGLAALVEVHDEAELKTALGAGAEIIGVNNRDLETLEVALETSLRLKESIPAGRLSVAESGIRSRQDVLRLERAGYDAVLLGEALMRADDPGAKLRELTGAAA
jgi:indole-3-glycerol phosphate synthase